MARPTSLEIVSELSAEQLHNKVREMLQRALEEEETPLTRDERRRLVEEIADDVLGFGPIEPFLRDPTVTEIMCNGPDAVYVEQAGRLVRTAARFTSEEHLRRVIDRIVSRVGRRIDESSPLVDARLADGSRVNAIIPPLAFSGSTLTIRKFSKDPFTVDDLIAFGCGNRPDDTGPTVDPTRVGPLRPLPRSDHRGPGVGPPRLAASWRRPRPGGSSGRRSARWSPCWCWWSSGAPTPARSSPRSSASC